MAKTARHQSRWRFPQFSHLPPEKRRLVRKRWSQLNNRSWQTWLAVGSFVPTGLVVLLVVPHLLRAMGPMSGQLKAVIGGVIAPVALGIPYLFISLPTAWRNYHRALGEYGLCPACGSDLPATSGCCPNCGAEPARSP